jgi:hypothetical protein
MHPREYAALNIPEALSASAGDSPIRSCTYMASISSRMRGTKMQAELRPKRERPTRVSGRECCGKPRRGEGPKQKRAREVSRNEKRVR